MSAFHEYGLSVTQSFAIAVTRSIATVSPVAAAVMPFPSQRSEWNHMYQLGLLYGFSRQLILPLPSPTLYGANVLQVKVSFRRFATGFGPSIPLYPGHV